MDRSIGYRTLCGAAVRLGGAFSIELLPRAVGDRERGESLVAAGDRRVVFETSLLWGAADDALAEGVGVRRESQARGAADAPDGAASRCPGATYESAAPGACGVSVFAAGRNDLSSKRGVVRGHHVRGDAARVPVLGGGDGLVQPVCARLGVVEFTRGGLLSGGAGPVRWRGHVLGYSTPTRGHSSRARSSRGDCCAQEFGSAWTVGDG
jgi:hypothetical protein